MFVVFEKGEKLHHILMAERFVQLDLVGQLFFGFVLDELALGNDFASESLPTTLFVTCLCTLKLITLGKSPLAEVLSTRIICQRFFINNQGGCGWTSSRQGAVCSRRHLIPTPGQVVLRCPHFFSSIYLRFVVCLSFEAPLRKMETR
eukprot:m.135771 g.135771  ORF g.135771 m.135771 type:complete len:147 (-) comp14877_c0_seq1:46-486(-)